MRSRRLSVMTLLLAIALVGPTLIATYAQHKGDRVAGTVQLINKDTMTILVSSELGSGWGFVCRLEDFEN